MEIKVGSFVVYKGAGPVYEILSRPLKLFEPKWDRWGWHMAFVCGQDAGGEWLVCEAVKGGVRVVPFAQALGFAGGYRVYDWFQLPLNERQVDKWVREHLGARYDVLTYFWTALQYFLRRVINHRIPRLLDGVYSCWELCFEFAEDFQRPFWLNYDAKYDMPVVTDFLRAMGEIPERPRGMKELSVMQERNRP